MQSPVAIYGRNARYYVLLLLLTPLLLRGVLLSMQAPNSWSLWQGVGVLARGVAHDSVWMLLLSCPLVGLTVWLNRTDIGKTAALLLRFVVTMVVLGGAWQVAAWWLQHQNWPSLQQAQQQWVPMGLWGVVVAAVAGFFAWPKAQPRVYRVGFERPVEGMSYLWMVHVFVALLAVWGAVRSVQQARLGGDFLKTLRHSPIASLFAPAVEPVVVPTPAPVPAPEPVVVAPVVVPVPTPEPVPATIITPPIVVPAPIITPPPAPVLQPAPEPVKPEPAPEPVKSEPVKPEPVKPAKVHKKQYHAPEESSSQYTPPPRKRQPPPQNDVLPPSGVIRNGVVEPL